MCTHHTPNERCCIPHVIVDTVASRFIPIAYFSVPRFRSLHPPDHPTYPNSMARRGARSVSAAKGVAFHIDESRGPAELCDLSAVQHGGTYATVVQSAAAPLSEVEGNTLSPAIIFATYQVHPPITVLFLLAYAYVHVLRLVALQHTLSSKFCAESCRACRKDDCYRLVLLHSYTRCRVYTMYWRV